MEWDDMIKRLRLTENPVEALEEVKGRLSESSDLKLAERLLVSDEIYNYLEDSADASSREQFDLACDILRICMYNVSLVNYNFITLRRAIWHNNVKIRSLAFNTILDRMEKHYEENCRLHDDFLQIVFGALEDKETSLGIPAIGIIAVLLKSKLHTKYTKASLYRALHKNTVVRCRVFEIAVNVAKDSPERIENVQWILDYALAELDNDDVLLQMNILEILASLAEVTHGLNLLEERQVFDVISRRVETVNDNHIDLLLVPGIMKFFGKIAALHPKKIILGYPHMIEGLFKCITSEDSSILPAAFDTMANLFRTGEAIVLLEAQYSDKLQDVFQLISKYLSKLPSDLKARIFQTLEIVFTIDDGITEDIKSILQKWFSHLAGGTNMSFLFEFCRNPFPDIQVSCLSFIKALCHYNWGIVALKDTAGLVEHLLDRKSEYNHDTKYANYEVIKLLAESTSVFDMHTLLQLQTYVKDGPYFVQSVMEVAVEGN